MGYRPNYPEQLVIANILLAARATGMVKFSYKNHNNVITDRRVRPIAFRAGDSTGHPDCRTVMDTYDEDKNTMRTFTLEDINPTSIAPYGV